MDGSYGLHKRHTVGQSSSADPRNHLWRSSNRTKKKDDGIRPFAVGYTLRRLAAKCVNSHVITAKSNELKPIQVGVGVSGGAEAAFHAVRRFVGTVEDDNVLVTLGTLRML